MKLLSIFVVYCLCLGNLAHAGAKREKSPRRPSSACGKKSIMYQPGGSNLPTAARGFMVEMEMFADKCIVQEKMDLQKDQEIYVSSFVKSGNEETVTYEVNDFSDRTKKDCSLTLVSKMKSDCAPGQICAAVARYEYSVKGPECSESKTMD